MISTTGLIRKFEAAPHKPGSLQRNLQASAVSAYRSLQADGYCKTTEKTRIVMRGQKMTANENKKYITWEKKFELGIPVIDNQHRRLVGLCNSLYLALIDRQELSRVGNAPWQIALSDAIRSTVDYVQTHFRDEEKILTAIEYPELAHHKAQHQYFTAKIMELLTGFHDADVQEAIDLLRFLYNWILEHIAVEDKKYVPAVSAYLQNRR